MHIPNKDLETINGLFASGDVTPIIDKTFPLADAVAAFNYFGTGSFKGKIIITIDSNSGHN
jgi:NADPH:quinone reductase-like Zn-dependent oxidoreductase